MKTINLNFDLKDLDGVNLQPESNAGKVLAGIMMSEVKGDAVKYFDWAMTLNQKKPIQVDDSDFIKLKELVLNREGIYLLARAQYLKYFATIK